MTEYFALSNEHGQRYELDDQSTGFLFDVGNVGYRIDRSYIRLGDKWIATAGTSAQEEIQGIVLFSEDAYDAKKELLEYLRRSQELTLHQISPAGEYLIDVDLNHLDRSALSDTIRQFSVTFAPRSLWYTETVLQFYLDMETSDHKEFAYRYSYLYNQFSSGTVEVENDGSVAAAFHVDFHGPIVDPVIELYQGDTLTAQCSITGEAVLGETIRYSSDDANLYCYLEGITETEEINDEEIRNPEGETVSEGGQVVLSDPTITNLVEYFDITQSNFFKLPVGESKLKISADSSITKPINITIFKYYRTV